VFKITIKARGFLLTNRHCIWEDFSVKSGRPGAVVWEIRGGSILEGLNMSKAAIRRNCLIGCAIAALTFNVRHAGAFSNTEQVQNDTADTETELDVQLEGDVAGDIDSYINPFGPMGTESASYNGMSNETTVQFEAGADGTPVPEGEPAEVGLEDDHEGLVFNGKDWVTPEEMQEPAPTIEGTDEGTGAGTEFEVVEGKVETSGDAQSSTEYTEMQENGEGQPMQVEITNDDTPEGGSLYANNFGYLLSPTLIPLDDLNATDYPPSMFTPVPGITNGEQVSPDSTIESSDISVPEPGSLALVGGAGTFVAMRRRRKVN
jgi:hypothetical protein